MNTIRGTYNDYNRKTYRHITFDVYDKLPEIGSVIEDVPHDYQSTLADFRDITSYIDMPVYDGGYYTLYKIWKNVKQYNDVEQFEVEDYIAVWTPYGEEEDS